MPAPDAVAVCSPIRRSRSAGSRVARAGGGCGKTSTRSGRSVRLAWPIPSVHVAVTVQSWWRPQACGWSTQRALAACPATATWVTGPSMTVTAGPGSIRNVTSSTGAATVATISTSSPSKQRDGAAVTAASRASGRVPRRVAASAARAGAPSSSRSACRVRNAASTTATPIVASLRSLGAACQVAGTGATGTAALAGPGAGPAAAPGGGAGTGGPAGAGIVGSPRTAGGPSVTGWPWAPARR